MLIIHHSFTFHNLPILEIFNWHSSTLQHLGSSDFEWLYFGLDSVQITLELVHGPWHLCMTVQSSHNSVPLFPSVSLAQKVNKTKPVLGWDEDVCACEMHLMQSLRTDFCFFSLGFYTGSLCWPLQQGEESWFSSDALLAMMLVGRDFNHFSCILYKRPASPFLTQAPGKRFTGHLSDSDSVLHECEDYQLKCQYGADIE